MSESRGSFLDPTTIIAIVLVALSWFTWDSYMRNKYPHIYVQKNVENPVEAEELKKEGEGSLKEPKKIGGAYAEDDSEGQAEVLHKYQSDWISFVLTSKGMGLYDVVLNKYEDREGAPMLLGRRSGSTLFETNLIGNNSRLDFSVEKVSDNKFVGEASYGLMKIIKTLSIHPENYTVSVDVKVSQITVEFLGVTTYLSAAIEPDPEQSFFMPRFGGQEVFTLSTEGKESQLVSEIEGGSTSHYNSVLMASLGTQYFTQSILDHSDVLPSIVFFKESGAIVGRLNHSILNRSSEFSVNYIGFVGPKSMELLENLNPEFSHLINFGWFHWIGTILLKLMIMFYNVSNNWGVSIILMTILVRLILLPLNLFSYKSMKNMQKIQPDLKRVRETYKEDPIRMNKEVMALMKQNKANPLSGCLPMLLQFPIFIALYRVFGSKY